MGAGRCVREGGETETVTDQCWLQKAVTCGNDRIKAEKEVGGVRRAERPFEAQSECG